MMNLMYEIDTSEQSCVISESLNEATGEKTKKYRIKGIFSTIGERNRNGRIYPRNLWEREVQNYQQVLSSGSLNTLCEWQHPPRNSVDPMEAIAKMEKLYIDGKYVMGEAVLLDNPKANQLKSLIDNGVKLSVSSRGVGKVNNGIVEDFRLTTFDLVDFPSCESATMNGVVEGYTLQEGILKEKEFILTESGTIEEVTPKEKTIKDFYSTEEIQSALKEKFEKFLKEI